MNNGHNTLILPSGYKETMIQSDMEYTYREALDILLHEYGSTLADLQLAQEDIGWEKLGSQSTLDMDSRTRNDLVRRSRAYYNRDPLAKQTIRLWTSYSLGTGVTWKADDEKTTEILDTRLWGLKENKAIFSPQGQQKTSDKLLVDGELFLAIFNGPDGIKVRRIDPLQIEEIISDPEDDETPRYYKRRAQINRQEKQMVYRDWNNDDSSPIMDSMGQLTTAIEDAAIFHVAINTLGKRGLPLLTPMLDWSKAYRKFMEARASIVQALARFAWKGKVQGSSSVVTALKNQLQSTIAGGQDTETNPPPAAGSTLLQNAGFDMEQMKVDTGAGNAQTDGNMLLTMAGAGVGIFPHYFGAGEAFRLATSTSMEAPMLKQFESYQYLWIGDNGIFDQLFDYTLADASVPEEKWFVDIDAPPIVQKDVPTLVHAQLEATQAFPAIADTPEFKKLVLTTLGINNPNEVLENLSQEEAIKKAEREQSASEELAKLKAEQGAPVPGEVPPQLQPFQPQQALKLAQEVRKLTEAIRGTVS